jgi:hypothetical protein
MDFEAPNAAHGFPVRGNSQAMIDWYGSPLQGT